LMCRRCVFACAWLLFATSALAQDQPHWYLGADLSRVDDRFQPHYTTYEELTKFDNRAHGLGNDLFFGREYRVTNRLSIAGQALVGISRTKWNLSIPAEPADLQYWLPYLALGSIVPDVKVKKNFSVFADIGAGLGLIREMKVSGSNAPSTYDVSELRQVNAIGIGLRWKFSEGYDLFVRQRWLQYHSIEYDTFNRGGTFLEHVIDEPRSRSIAIGVRTTY